MDGQASPSDGARRGGAPAGDAAVCLTCSDAGTECLVVEVDGAGMARVETPEGFDTVGVALVDARPGDRVLVHAGEALAVVARP